MYALTGDTMCRLTFVEQHAFGGPFGGVIWGTLSRARSQVGQRCKVTPGIRTGNINITGCGQTYRQADIMRYKQFTVY